MDIDPHGLLAQVHPDLVKIYELAGQTPAPFDWEVTYGLRTLAAEQAAVAAGHSETLHSRHLPQAGEGGLSCAVDITCFENGAAVELGPRVAPVYTAVAAHIMAAAVQLAADGQIKRQLDGSAAYEWGGEPIGAWTPGVVSNFRDWGHGQLTWKEYP